MDSRPAALRGRIGCRLLAKPVSRSPTGCLGGSCGACEIDVNGKTIRACIATVPASKSGELSVELASDPYW